MTAWWTNAIWTASMRGGLALLVALLFSLVPRVPAMVRSWMWRAAYGVLLVSFVWSAPVNLPIRHPMQASPIKSVEAMPAIVLLDSNDTNPTLISPESKVAAKPEPDGRHWNWAAIGVGMWSAFIAAYAIGLLLSWRASRGLHDAPVVAAGELEQLCQKMGIGHPPVLRTHPSVQGPLLIGVLRPSIVLPEWALSSTELASILAHELAHLSRQDLLWNWLPTLAQAILPVHPLVWICNRRWRLATESACDAAALTATSIAPADYGRALVHAGSFPPPLRHGVLAVAVTADSRWLLKQRITLMQRITFWNHRRLVVASLTIAVSGMIAAVPWRVVAQSAPTSKPAQAVTQTPPLQSPKSQTARATPTESLPNAVVFAGKVVARNDTLRASAAGTISKVEALVGQRVKRGDLLVQMDETLAQLDVKQAKAKVDYAGTDLSRKREGSDRHIVSALEVALASSQLELATSEFERANFELEKTRVSAPFDGIVAECDVEVGDAIEFHQALVSVVESGPLQVRVNVPQDDCGLIKMGMPVVVGYRVGEKLVEIEAEVKTLAPMVDPGSGMRNVTVEVKSSPAELLPGMYVQTTIHAAG